VKKKEANHILPEQTSKTSPCSQNPKPPRGFTGATTKEQRWRSSTSPTATSPASESPATPRTEPSQPEISLAPELPRNETKVNGNTPKPKKSTSDFDNFQTLFFQPGTNSATHSRRMRSTRATTLGSRSTTPPFHSGSAQHQHHHRTFSLRGCLTLPPQFHCLPFHQVIAVSFVCWRSCTTADLISAMINNLGGFRLTLGPQSLSGHPSIHPSINQPINPSNPSGTCIPATMGDSASMNHQFVRQQPKGWHEPKPRSGSYRIEARGAETKCINVFHLFCFYLF
jgi:hypothetical protein